MPERGFDSAFWGDRWVRKNMPLSRYLFIYLWTNDHCNQAGVYEITLDTMALETSLPVSKLPDLLMGLSEKVKWFPEQDLIWVKNFIRKQAKSPKFLIAAAKCLMKIKNNGLVEEVLEYNLKRHSVSIPYTYSIDSVSIPSASVSVSSSGSGSGSEEEGERGSGGKPNELEKITPPEVGEYEPGGKKAELLKRLRSLKLWRTTGDDGLWLDGFLEEFPEFDIERMTACVDYHSGHETAELHKGIWKNRLRNWAKKERQFALERKDSGQRGNRRIQASRGEQDFATERW